MQNLFLAHSSKDKEFARNLYDDLLKLGFRVWFDEVEMEPGDSLIQKIGSAIRSSMNLAVLLSKDSVSSKWVEIYYGRLGFCSSIFHHYPFYHPWDIGPHISLFGSEMGIQILQGACEDPGDPAER